MIQYVEGEQILIQGQFFHTYCVPFGRTLIRLCLVQLVMHFMCLCSFFFHIYIY